MGPEEALPPKAGVRASRAGSRGRRPQRPAYPGPAGRQRSHYNEGEVPQRLGLPFSLKLEKLGLREVE